jgi:hypothetical protein
MAAVGPAYELHSLVKCSIYPSVIVPDGVPSIVVPARG